MVLSKIVQVSHAVGENTQHLSSKVDLARKDELTLQSPWDQLTEIFQLT